MTASSSLATRRSWVRRLPPARAGHPDTMQHDDADIGDSRSDSKPGLPTDTSAAAGGSASDGAESASHPATITPYRDGPLIVRGSFRIMGADGLEIDPGRKTVALCRCGRSALKPFCDGSHAVTGFRAKAGDERSGPGPSRTERQALAAVTDLDGADDESPR